MRITVTLPDHVVRNLRALAKQSRITVSTLVKHSVTLGLAQGITVRIGGAPAAQPVHTDEPPVCECGCELRPDNSRARPDGSLEHLRCPLAAALATPSRG